ncbi:MAG: barstar family protein [Saprospiraceae bacterium]|nr:barstar family protein [Saprospiraceae bacterium]
MKLLDSLPAFPPHVFVAEIDGAKAQTLRGFYPRIAKTLIFPDYFGKNLDALLDCLSSLEVVGQQEVVLLIRNAQLFLSKEKEEKKTSVLHVFRDAEKPENRYDGVTFRVVGIRGKK